MVPRALGTFEFKAGKTGSVVISNEKADGFVVVDGVQFVPEDVAKAERATHADAGFPTRPALCVQRGLEKGQGDDAGNLHRILQRQEHAFGVHPSVSVRRAGADKYRFATWGVDSQRQNDQDG